MTDHERDQSFGEDRSSGRRAGNRPVPERAPLRSRAGRTRNPLPTSRTPQYLVIGHICADLQPDGSVHLGGTALYSALTAARLGWRTAILTRGAFGGTFDGIEVPSLGQYADQIQIICQDADTPTVMVNEYQADRRVQQIRGWAGPIDLRGLPPHWRNARIIHLGPVAQEIDQRQTGALTPEFLGVTPQGWMRDWPRTAGGHVKLQHLRIQPELLARVDGIVVSVEEIAASRDTVERVATRGFGVVTRGEAGARVLHPAPEPRPRGGKLTQTVDLPGVKVRAVDLTGAGDVFAAAFFIRALERGVTAEDAGRFANAVAALSLRAPGPTGVPTPDEVKAALAR